MKNKILFFLMAIFLFSAIRRLVLGENAPGLEENTDTIIVELILAGLCGAAIWQGTRSEKSSRRLED